MAGKTILWLIDKANSWAWANQIKELINHSTCNSHLIYHVYPNPGKNMLKLEELLATTDIDVIYCCHPAYVRLVKAAGGRISQCVVRLSGWRIFY